jgi:HK97 gp10 family phage protein
MSVKVTGIEECEAALNELTNATARNVLRRALTKAAEPVETAAKRFAPVNQGVLRSDIVTSTQLTKSQRNDSPKKGTTVYVGVSGRRGPFAHLLEWGTAHSAPHPFMRPAWDSNAGAVLAIFIRELRAEIEKAKERARRKAARILAKG